MGVHILGVKQDGVMARFTHEYTDDEFYRLIDEIGGLLPPGWAAWHLDDGETLTNSKRVQAISTRVPSVIGIYGAQPSKVWIKEMLKDDVRKYHKSLVTA
jgi:hypothetical protein